MLPATYPGGMRRFSPLIFLCAFSLLAATVHGAGFASSPSQFYRNRIGDFASFGMMRHYWRVPIVHPSAHVDPRIDPKLQRAATIGQERASARSKMRCWRYVKEALLAAGAVRSYPKTTYAAEAGDELVRDYGFKRLSVRDPYSAPLGAVIVYGNKSRGHVEIRTRDGFVSDYHSKNRCFYRVLAVYGKFSS